MELWGGLGINLLSALISFILGLLANKIWHQFKTRGHRRFWRPFLNRATPLSIVLTDKLGLKTRSPLKISLTDVRAYSDVQSILQLLGRETEIKIGSLATMQELEKDSFISLGGPKANGISEQILNRLTLPVEYDETNECFHFGGSAFKAQLNNEGFLVRDYGLAIRLLKLDENNSDSQPALIAFGLHGHGTEQTVKSIVKNRNLAKKLEIHLDENFYAFFKFEFSNHKCTKSEILSVDGFGRG